MLLQEAFKLVIAKGKIDGCEHFLALAPDGRVKVEKDGTVNHVMLREEIEAGLLGRGDRIVHNHPSKGSLSQPDLCLASRLGATIWAVAEDGSRYESGGYRVPNLMHIPLAAMLASFQECLVGKMLAHGLERGMFSEDEASLSLTHLLNVRLREEGLIDYDYVLEGGSREILSHVIGATRVYSDMFKASL